MLRKKSTRKHTRRYHCQHASIQHELTARRTVGRNVHFTANCSMNVLKIALFPPIFRHLFKPVEWNLFNNFNFATKCSKNLNILYVCVWVGVLLCVCFLARKKKLLSINNCLFLWVCLLWTRAHAYARKQFWHILFLIHVVFFMISRTHIFVLKFNLLLYFGFRTALLAFFFYFVSALLFRFRFAAKSGTCLKILTKLLNGCINFGISGNKTHNRYKQKK